VITSPGLCNRAVDLPHYDVRGEATASAPPIASSSESLDDSANIHLSSNHGLQRRAIGLLPEPAVQGRYRRCRYEHFDCLHPTGAPLSYIDPPKFDLESYISNYSGELGNPQP
jgi:hypothetical protein